jgi:D-aminopeptidase
VTISADAPVPFTLIGADEPIETDAGEVTPAIVFVKIDRNELDGESLPVTFYVSAEMPDGTQVTAERENAFFGPSQ